MSGTRQIGRIPDPFRLILIWWGSIGESCNTSQLIKEIRWDICSNNPVEMLDVRPAISDELIQLVMVVADFYFNALPRDADRTPVPLTCGFGNWASRANYIEE